MSLYQLSRSCFYYLHLKEFSFAANFINSINFVFTLLLPAICTVTNFFQLISYSRQNNKYAHKYFMPLYLCSNQISIFVFLVVNLSVSSKYQTFPNLSNYSCKIFNFVFHITSTLLNWIHVVVPVLFKLYEKNSIVAMKRIRFFLFFLILIFCFIYSTDLLFLELIEVNPDFKNQSEKNIKLFQCGVNIQNNSMVFFLRDIIDFTFYCLIPIIIIIIIILDSKSPEFVKKIKIALFLFLFFWSPVFLVILYRDYQIVRGWIQTDYYVTYGFKIELIFTVFLIMNRIFPAVAAIMDASFNENTRSEFYKLLCTQPFRLKNPCEPNQHTLEHNKNQKNINIDQIRREFYSTYYSIRNSETLIIPRPN